MDLALVSCSVLVFHGLSFSLLLGLPDPRSLSQLSSGAPHSDGPSELRTPTLNAFSRLVSRPSLVSFAYQKYPRTKTKMLHSALTLQKYCNRLDLTIYSCSCSHTAHHDHDGTTISLYHIANRSFLTSSLLLPRRRPASSHAC